jgi:hypothetical protein
MSKQTQVSQEPGTTVISWSWRTPWTYVAFLVGPGLLLLGPRLGLVPFLWMAVGAFVLVWGVVSLVNRTTLSITEATVEVAHGPLPWAASWKVPLAGIQRVTRSVRIRSTGQPPRGGTFRHHGVEVVTSDGRFRLGQGVNSKRQADEIIAAIEERRMREPSSPPSREIPRPRGSYFIAGVKFGRDTDLAQTVRRQLNYYKGILLWVKYCDLGRLGLWWLCGRSRGTAWWWPGRGSGGWWRAGRGFVLTSGVPVRLARPGLANALGSYSS